MAYGSSKPFLKAIDETEDGGLVLVCNPKDPIWLIARYLEEIGSLQHIESILHKKNDLPTGMIKVYFKDARHNRQLFLRLKEEDSTEKVCQDVAAMQIKEKLKRPKDAEFIKNEPECKRMPEKTSTNNRLYCVTPRNTTIKNIVEDFGYYGPLDYVDTVTDQRNKKYTYVKFVNKGDAQKAFDNVDKKYGAVFSTPKRNEERGEVLKVRHANCNQMVTAHTFDLHKEICKIQNGEDGGGFERPDVRDCLPLTIRHKRCGENIPRELYRSHQAVCESKFDYVTEVEEVKRPYVHVSLPGMNIIAGDLMEHEPVHIHEKTGKELDPFAGVLWKKNDLIDLEQKETRRTTQRPTDKEINELIEYLTLMRSNRDQANPASNLLLDVEDNEFIIKTEGQSLSRRTVISTNRPITIQLNREDEYFITRHRNTKTRYERPDALDPE